MKKWIFIFIVPFMLNSCKSNYPVAQQSGKEDMAFLLFVGSKEYSGKKVSVSVDDKTTFDAKVVKSKKANRKGTQYGISTGRHQLKVQHSGKTIYQKEIFVSTQEVKQIILP